MKRNQSAEDYLEAILILSSELEYVHRIDVARRMNVSQPAVLKAINLLKGKGLIETDGMHLYLTDEGGKYAKKVYHRHCVIRDFLLALGINAGDADADACEMEHCVSAATFEAMEKFLDERK